VVIFVVSGRALLQVAAACDPVDLAGKVVIEVTNPLDTTKGGLQTLGPALLNTTSAREALLHARVATTLTVMTVPLMVAPSGFPARMTTFYSARTRMPRLWWPSFS
jgi:predicted dinucleotide-binding enzyme